MPPPSRSLQDLVDDGLTPDKNGSRLQRGLYYLNTCTFVTVRQADHADATRRALGALWKEEPSVGTELLPLLLAVYILGRVIGDGEVWQGGKLSLQRYNDLLSTVNPRSGLSLRYVMDHADLHSVEKCDDPFTRNLQTWWREQTRHKLNQNERNMTLLTGFFMLAVRSGRLLKWCLQRPEFKLRDVEAFSSMYEDLCLQDAQGPFLGLDPRKTRQKHTSEQKHISAGWLLDRLLQPCWRDPTLLNNIAEAHTCARCLKALSELPVFRGDFVQSHTLEYLFCCEQVAEHRLLRCKMSRDFINANFFPGSNSKVFLQIANATGRRSTGGALAFKEVAARVRKSFPKRISVGGKDVSLPKIDTALATQNACKAVEVLQTWLCGRWGGKKRQREEADE